MSTRQEPPRRRSAGSVSGTRTPGSHFGRHRSLQECLSSSPKQTETLSYEQVEDILRFGLPPSAYQVSGMVGKWGPLSG